MASAPVFRTDVTIRAPQSQNLLERQSQQRTQTSDEYLDSAAENVNKQIDNDIRQMLDSFESLIGLSRIRDKDKFRIAQENFELEGRADAMVRSAQSLTLLSHSLKLSLLFTQEPIEGKDGDSLDEEAINLIESTAASKKKCAEILQKMFNIGNRDEEEATSEKGESKAEEGKSDQPVGKKTVPISVEETKPSQEDETLNDVEMEEV